MSRTLGPSEEQNQGGIFYKTLALLFVSGLLLFLDTRVEQIQIVRRSLEYTLAPSYLTLNFLIKQQQSFSSYLSLNKKQLRSLEALELRNIQLETILAAKNHLDQENRRLKQLLDYRHNSNATDSQVAQVIGQKLNSRQKEIVLDKGKIDGISERLAVVTSAGLMGQVIMAGPFTSRVLLTTDTRHATPVMVARNKNRFILSGIGDSSLMVGRDVDSNVDIRIGDLLVTSGLGDLFPPELPVAKVTSIDTEKHHSFRQIWARSLVNPHATQFVLVGTE